MDAHRPKRHKGSALVSASSQTLIPDSDEECHTELLHDPPTVLSRDLQPCGAKDYPIKETITHRRIASPQLPTEAEAIEVDESKRSSVRTPKPDHYTSENAPTGPVAFTNARGHAIAMPSAKAQAHALALFRTSERSAPTKIEQYHRSQVVSYSDNPLSQKTESLGFTTAMGSAVQISDEARRRALKLLSDSDDALLLNPPQVKERHDWSVDEIEPKPPTNVVSPFRPLTLNTPKDPQTLFQCPAPSRPRSPLDALSTPQTNKTKRHINLGMIPLKSSQANVKRPRFSTPFIGGVRPPKWELYSSPKATPSSLVSKTTSYLPVYNISSPPARQCFADLNVQPQAYDIETLVGLGLPNAVIFMNYRKATEFAFNCDAGPSGPSEAHARILADGCATASLKWTSHHWALIVWKLAAVIRLCPHLLKDLWTPGHVVDQLKYRYEREWNRGHRSALRLIQDRDVSAALPLCLAVCGIIEASSVADDPDSILDSGRVLGLELTDGWYHIRADLDLVLKRAVWARRIHAGDKLAISGARLQSDHGDAADMFATLKNSRLVLGANGVAKAPWMENLGLRARPWVSTLRALSPSGGVVPLLDVVVLRMFPSGFIDLDGDRQAPWDLREELRQQEEHVLQRSLHMEKLIHARQRERSRVEGIKYRLHNLKQNSRRRAESVSGIFDDEAIWEHILEAGITEDIKSLPVDVLDRLLVAAKEHIANLDSGDANLISQLDEDVPRRRVREFRVVRVTSWKHLRRRSNRTALVTIHDLSLLGEGLLEEGAAFRVSNLVPQQPNAWRPHDHEADIFLATRRDTHWGRLPANLGM